MLKSIVGTRRLMRRLLRIEKIKRIRCIMRRLL